MDVGNKIRKLRELRGIEQLELASKINISQSKMNKIETGFQKRLEPEILRDIAKALSVTTDELLGHEMEIDNQNQLEYYKNKIITEFPDIDLMFKDMANLTGEDLKEVYEFIKFKSQQEKGK